MLNMYDNLDVHVYYVTPKKIYTVSIITYKDGAVYTSNNYSYEEQSTFYVSSLTSAPSGYHLNYLTVNGYTHNTLSVSITVTNNIVIYVYYEADKIRPADWAWTTTIAQDSVIKLTAQEWNNFTSKINEFREYADLSANSFTIAKSGTPIKATICNEAYTAIDAISGHGTLPSKPASGDLLYASFFNDLKDALNAIK